MEKEQNQRKNDLGHAHPYIQRAKVEAQRLSYPPVYSACQGRRTEEMIPTCIFSVPRQRDGEGREPIVERPRRVCVAIDQQQCGDHKHGVTQPCNITKQSIKCLREVKHTV